MQKTVGDSWARRDGTLEDSYPRLLASLNTVPGAAAWAFGNYVQLIAATGTPFVASWADFGFYCDIVAPTATLAFNGELEYATGAAAAEVPFATVPFASSCVLVNNTDKVTSAIYAFGQSVPIGPKYIPSGTRIAVRIRTSIVLANDSMRVRPYIIGYDGGAAPAGVPSYTLRGQQTGIQPGRSNVTDVGAGVSITSGAAAWGAWTQLNAGAATTGEVIIIGLAGTQTPGLASKWALAEIGTGAAGSEVTRARIWFPGYSYSFAGYHTMHRPLLIKPGEILSVRLYSSAAVTLNVQLLYEQH